MTKKYVDVNILVEWLESREENEKMDYGTRVGYGLAASEIAIIADLLPSSEKNGEDIINSPDDLQFLFHKYEEENPYIPTEDEQQKAKFFATIEKAEKFANLFLFAVAGFIILILILTIKCLI